MGIRRFRQKSDAHAYLKSESGQSIILVSVVILSFLMFFMFALNTGLLINAKISVQSAADAAAYAGAATQARQLNAISYLNYDMRRQYKKFLFRNVFVGSMGSPDFPNNADPADQSPTYDFPKNDFSSGKVKKIATKVPVVCIPLTSAGVPNDNCLNVNLPDTNAAIRANIGSGGGLNAITQALIDNINNIQNLQNNLCKSQGDMNLFVLLAWLFRGDPSPDQLIKILTELQRASAAAPGGSPNNNADLTRSSEAIKGLVSGLGLYPRNIINLMRIQTLEGFINERRDPEITLEKAKSWESADIAETKERSLQAFHSALANLNADVFDANMLKVSELESDILLKTDPVLINFNSYVQMMARNATATPSGVICSSVVLPFHVLSAPVGVKIVAPNLRVNYAVRVRAFVKPRGLLFLPGSDPLELDAVAGAKPFGSRIGPKNISAASFTKAITPALVNGKEINNCQDPLAGCFVPDIDIGAGLTAYSKAYLQDLRNKATNNGPSFTAAGILNAEKHAMAPSPQEVGHYNILPPPKNGGDMDYEFIPYADGPASTVYRFYAPIFPKSGGGNADNTIDKFIDQVFAKVSVGPDPVFNIDMTAMRQQIGDAIKKYVKNNLPSGQQSENGETESFAAINLPMAGLTASQGFWLTKSQEVLSSWGPQHSRVSGNDLGLKPRFGYSVKFATMQNLVLEGVLDDDGDLAKTHH